MPSSPVQEIKEKLDIVEVLRERIALQPAGKNWKALCPFHSEKTPSFMVSPERQSWHCFGCGAGGDLFSFVMQYEGMDFGEALKVLAEQAGVELKRISPQEYRQFGLIYDMNEHARDFFRRSLEKSEAAKKYLASRGLKQETLDEFEVGWAPQGTDELAIELVNKGFDPDDVIRAGLSVKTQRGLAIDRFRGRIMFPIHTHSGKIAGFTGRVLPEFESDDTGKYVNTPETPVFTKSKILYGFSRTKSHIREAGEAFLVEGQTDVLMSWQAGVKNVAASSGTALTDAHLQAVKRIAEKVVLGMDTDEAGMTALERAIDLAGAHDLSVRVVTFGEYKDAAEAAQKDPSLVMKCIKEAVPAPAFYFRRYLPEGVPDLRDRDTLKRLRTVVSKIKAMASPLERDVWFRELSVRTGIDSKVLLEEAERVETASSPRTKEAEQKQPRVLTRWERLSEELLSAVPGAEADMVGEYAEYLHPLYRKVYEIMQKGEKRAADPLVDERMNLISLGAVEREEEELAKIRTHLKQEGIRARREELARIAKEAEAKGDEAGLEGALRAISELPHV